MNELTRKSLSALLLLAVVAAALAPDAEAKRPPKCDPELGCIIVRPK